MMRLSLIRDFFRLSPMTGIQILPCVLPATGTMTRLAELPCRETVRKTGDSEEQDDERPGKR